MNARRMIRITGLGAAMLLTSIGTSAAQTSITLTPDVATFEDDINQVTVDVMVANATGAAGIDLTIEFPAERFLETPVFAEGTLNGAVVVNDTQPGKLILAFARATGLTEDTGVLASFTFSAPCEGNQGFPDGNPVDFTFSEFLVWDEMQEALPVDDTGSAVALKCTAVANQSITFSAAKARFGR